MDKIRDATSLPESSVPDDAFVHSEINNSAITPGNSGPESSSTTYSILNAPEAFTKQLSDTLDEIFQLKDHEIQRAASDQLLQELAAATPLPPQDEDKDSSLRSPGASTGNESETISERTHKLPSPRTIADLLPEDLRNYRWQEGKVQGGGQAPSTYQDKGTFNSYIDLDSTNAYPLIPSLNSGNFKNVWIADSGAVTYILNDDLSFCGDMRYINSVIGTVDESSILPIKGVGISTLTLRTPGNGSTDFFLIDTVYALSAVYNLLSLPKLVVKANIYSTWNKNYIIILTSDRELVGRVPL